MSDKPIDMSARLMDLVRIPTVSHESEFAMMAKRIGWKQNQQKTIDQAKDYLRAWLHSFADETGEQPVSLPGYQGYNLWARINGLDSSRAILLQGHYDVVEVNGDYFPHIESDRLYGRGSTDMKGALVSGICALENLRLLGQRPAVDTYILLTCEEEIEARGAFFTAEHPFDWMKKVVFAICMESGYDIDGVEFATQHPGIACVTVESPVQPAQPGKFFWRMWVDVGRENVLHASREPLTLEPNAVIMDILRQIPNCRVAHWFGDREPNGPANTTSAFSECIFSADIEQAEIELVTEKVIAQYTALMKDTIRADALKSRGVFKLEAVASQICWDASSFIQAISDFRTEVKKDYTNRLYEKPPFTIAALLVKDGQAKAKIDIRTDSPLREQMQSLLESHFVPPAQAKTLWNDPGLDENELQDNPFFIQFKQTYQKYNHVRINAHSGWTEASIWSALLGIPTVVMGPGQLEVAHTQDEYIELRNMLEFSKVLENFLYQVV